VGRIHGSALRILEEVGLKVDSSDALEIFAEAGAKVDLGNKRVWIPAKVVEKSLGLAPSTVVLHGREPRNCLVLEGTRVYMGTGEQL